MFNVRVTPPQEVIPRCSVSAGCALLCSYFLNPEVAQRSIDLTGLVSFISALVDDKDEVLHIYHYMYILFDIYVEIRNINANSRDERKADSR